MLADQYCTQDMKFQATEPYTLRGLHGNRKAINILSGTKYLPLLHSNIGGIILGVVENDFVCYCYGNP